jgi:protocatechuate 3,4-dioxygenase beta subunit
MSVMRGLLWLIVAIAAMVAIGIALRASLPEGHERSSRPAEPVSDRSSRAIEEPGARPPATRDTALVVTVVDADTGVPIPRARLRLEPRGGVASWASCDDGGKASIRPLYGELGALADGYVAASRPFAEHVRRATIALSRGLVVTGRVVHAASGAGVAGAHVVATDVESIETLARLVTDEKGRFRIPGVRAGVPFAVEAWAEGLAKVGIVERVSGPGHELRLELGVGATLHGLVLGPDGAPAPAARVEIRPRGLVKLFPDREDRYEPAYEIVLETDAAGRFRVAGLRSPAVYALEAESAGAATGTLEGVTCRPGRTTDCEIRLSARTIVRVRVVFPKGEVPAQATVSLWRNGQAVGPQGRTEYELTEAGRYEARALTLGNWPVARATVDVELGKLHDVVLTMSRAGSRVVSGRVVSDRGQPLHDMLVRMTDDIQARTRRDGSFHLCDVPADRGTVTVEDYRGIWRTAKRGGVAPGGPPLEIVLAPGGRFVGRIEPPRPGVRFLQLFRSAPPLENLKTERRGELVTDARGRFELPFAAGRALRMILEPRKGGSVTFEEPALADGETRDLGVVRFGPGTTAEVRVLDEAGNPIDGARVVVAFENIYRERAYHTDAAGRCRAEGLPHAPLHVEIQAAGYVTRSADFATGQELHLLEVRLQPAGFVEGTLIGADGKPVTEDDVTLRSLDRDQEYWAEMDSLGRFRMAAAPGRYRLMYGAIGGPTVEVQPRATTRAEFRVR